MTDLHDYLNSDGAISGAGPFGGFRKQEDLMSLSRILQAVVQIRATGQRVAMELTGGSEESVLFDLHLDDEPSRELAAKASEAREKGDVENFDVDLPMKKDILSTQRVYRCHFLVADMKTAKVEELVVPFITFSDIDRNGPMQIDICDLAHTAQESMKATFRRDDTRSCQEVGNIWYFAFNQNLCEKPE